MRWGIFFLYVGNSGNHTANANLVSLAAVFSIVTQRSFVTILKTAARETNANQTDARFFSSVVVVVVVVAFGNKRGIRKSDEKIAGCGIFVKKEQEYAGSGPPPPPPFPFQTQYDQYDPSKKKSAGSGKVINT